MLSKNEPSARHSTMESFFQLAAAFAVGGFNSAALLVVLSAPFMLWLAWRFPYFVLPPGITYVLLSFDGAEFKDGRPWAAFTRTFWMFQQARAYLDLQIHIDPALEPSKMTGDEQFIFGVHPHGALADYRALMDGLLFDSFPKLRSWRVLAASILFKIPIWREICLWTHCVDAGRTTAQYVIEKGHSLLIVPGGEREQILGQFGKEILYLKSRMGFVKIALKNGVPLVPVYVFGANDLFYTSTFLQSFRVALTRQFRVAIPLFCGRWGLPSPRRVPLRIVFGEPLKFTKPVAAATEESSDPGSRKGSARQVTDQEVKEAHAAYVTALQKLFNDNKAKFGYPDRELRIF